MVRLIQCLWLLTFLLGSNAYAWYCNIQPSTSGYLVTYDHVQCHDIDSHTAIQNYWCPSRPQDPICTSTQPIIPACSDHVEYQSLACQPNYSGTVNQSRTYYCQTNTYSDWVTTSNNCTPNAPTCQTSSTTEQRQACGINQVGTVTFKKDSICPDPYGQPVDTGWHEIARSCQPAPPTCHTTTETQTLSCGTHQHGSISQSRSSTCPDPYGQPVMGDWVTTTNTCAPDPATCLASTQTRTLACASGYTGTTTEVQQISCSDPYSQPIFGAWVETQNLCVKSITNVTNPVSPVSPISPVAAPTPVVESAPVEQQPAPQIESAAPITTNVVPSTTETKTQTKTEIKQESKTEIKQESKQEDTPKSPDVPKGKELVQGFGIVMSLDLINAPIKFQQQQLEIAIEYSQELPDGIRGNQEFITELITQGSATNLFDIGSKRWRDLYRNYEVQPDY